MNHLIRYNSSFIKTIFKKGMKANEEKTPPWVEKNSSRKKDYFSLKYITFIITFTEIRELLLNLGQ